LIILGQLLLLIRLRTFAETTTDDSGYLTLFCSFSQHWPKFGFASTLIGRTRRRQRFIFIESFINKKVGGHLSRVNEFVDQVWRSFKLISLNCVSSSEKMCAAPKFGQNAIPFSYSFFHSAIDPKVSSSTL
jgi:hypothetical protein